MNQQPYGLQIEFLGGPIDGHTELTSFPLKTLVLVIAPHILPRAGLARTLLCKWFGAVRPAFVSEYVLCRMSQGWYYRHVGSRFVAQDELQDCEAWAGSPVDQQGARDDWPDTAG